jgi:hypothetical protein
MWYIALLILMYILIQAVLLGSALAIGFLLHWIVPELNVGMAILVGLISTFVMAYLFVQLLWLGRRPDELMTCEEDEEEDEDAEEVIPQSHFPTKAQPLGKRRSRNRF